MAWCALKVLVSLIRAGYVPAEPNLLGALPKGLQTTFRELARPMRVFCPLTKSLKKVPYLIYTYWHLRTAMIHYLPRFHAVYVRFQVLKYTNTYEISGALE